MKINFSPPFIDDDIIKEVVDTLNSGWITTGPKVRELESEIIKLTSCQHALAVNSWTSGAILVLKWFGVGPGDEVIIPAYTYSATALAVLHCGATPIMVDSLNDFTIDFSLLPNLINERTKVIIPVDFAGLMCDYDEIIKIVSDKNVRKFFKFNNAIQAKLNRILVLSDAAHSIGSSYKGKQSGNVADITIFSLHAVKNITTAEGGIICLNLPASFDSEHVFNYMKMMTLNGQTKDAFSKSIAGSWKYDIVFQGLKINMPDVCAAIGLAQIRKYKFLLNERKRVYEFYNNYFKNFIHYTLPVVEDFNRTSCNHLFPLRINNITESKRDQIIQEISYHGISVNVHFIPMPMLTLFKNLGYNINDFPVAYANYSSEISLPIYPQLTNVELLYICDNIEYAYKKLLNT